jgi:transcriptional regulator with XRE-family HTH domain
MKTLLKMQEEQKLKTREVAQLLGIDQALISKFESGTRKPTREQVVKLATLDIDLETIMVAWLKEKFYEIGQDEFALKALLVAEQEIRYQSKPTKKKSTTLQKILDEIDTFKDN